MQFIKELAEYQEFGHKVIATIDDLNSTLFCDNPRAQIIIIEVDNKPIGFALYFYNYTTLLCKYGVYIEDIYVKEEFRGKGYGLNMMKYIAKETSCETLEWVCLDNNKAAIDFYLKLGTKAMSDRTSYILDKEFVNKLIDL